jgi:hypothetical protein
VTAREVMNQLRREGWAARATVARDLGRLALRVIRFSPLLLAALPQHWAYRARQCSYARQKGQAQGPIT